TSVNDSEGIVNDSKTTVNNSKSSVNDSEGNGNDSTGSGIDAQTGPAHAKANDSGTKRNGIRAPSRPGRAGYKGGIAKHNVSYSIIIKPKVMKQKNGAPTISLVLPQRLCVGVSAEMLRFVSPGIRFCQKKEGFGDDRSRQGTVLDRKGMFTNPYHSAANDPRVKKRRSPAHVYRSYTFSTLACFFLRIRLLLC
ncbi:MAG: hypothetical protein JWP27_1444, partial [Flaviaesturariibacter sp.]|nr:hypothetical protein [Flaviaesturariibacter sp.]